MNNILLTSKCNRLNELEIDEEKFLKELSEALNTNRENIIDCISQGYIEVFTTPKDAYYKIMNLKYITKTDAVNLLMSVVGDKLEIPSYLQQWLDNNKDIIITEEAIVYMHSSFYNYNDMLHLEKEDLLKLLEIIGGQVSRARNSKLFTIDENRNLVIQGSVVIAMHIIDFEVTIDLPSLDISTSKQLSIKDYLRITYESIDDMFKYKPSRQELFNDIDITPFYSIKATWNDKNVNLKY